MSKDNGTIITQEVFLDQQMTEAAMLKTHGGAVAVFSSRCPGKETANEDAAACIHIPGHATVLIVADGVGGMRGGQDAARAAVEILCKTIAEAAAGIKENINNLRAAILDGIESANRAILDNATGAATTLAVVEVSGDRIRPYHVGDSEILLVGGQGKVKLQTVAHSPVGMAVGAGLLEQREAMHHIHRHIVSNVVGSTDMHIEVGPARKLATRDALLLASDGLMDNLHTEEIVQHIRKGPMEDAIANLATNARRRMESRTDPTEPSKPDDLTMILFRPRGK